MRSGIRTAVTVAVMALALGSCTKQATTNADAAKARQLAAAVLAESLDTLGHEPGVVIKNLPGGTRGCPLACPRTYVTVSGSAATGRLSFAALMARLTADGWTLGREQDTADSCTAGQQALPCLFTKGTSEGIVNVYPGNNGSYAVATAASR